MPLTIKSSLTRAKHRHQRLSGFLIAGNAVLGALLLALVVWVSHSSREKLMAQSRSTAEQLAAIAAANLQAEFDLVDTALVMTRDELRRAAFGEGAADHQITGILRARHSVLKSVEGLRIADSQGSVRWGNLTGGAPVPNVSEREFFRKAQTLSSGEIVVSGPIISRVSGNWVVILARPLVWGGKFRGVVYASIATQHFVDLFQRYDVSAHDSITLRTNDMQLVAWLTPGSSFSGPVGTREVSPELQTALSTAPSLGSYVSTGRTDGVERSIAYRKVQDWPFMVSAGLNNATFLEHWKNERWTVSLFAAVAWLLSCAATFVVYRAGLSNVRAVAALEAQGRRTQTLLRVAGDGIHIVDHKGYLVELSDSFAQMHGVPRDVIHGQHVSSWDVNQDAQRINAWLSKLKDGQRQRVEVQHRRADGSILDIDLHWHCVDIDGQLFVFGSARDITDHKRLLLSLEESSSRIRDLYDQAPCGYFSLDAEGQFVHANEMVSKWIGFQPRRSQTKLVEVLDEQGREAFGNHFIGLASETNPPDVEVWLVPTDAEKRFVRLSSTAVKDAKGRFLMSRTIAVDITEQHQAQMQVRALLLEQSAMLNSDVVGMVKIRHGKVSWNNSAFDCMMGYDTGEILGKEVFALCAPDDATYFAAKEASTRISEGTNYRGEVRLKRKGGELLWADLNGVQLSNDETFWMAVDISEAKRAHDQVSHAAYHDALTQLPNRLLLMDRMHQALASAARSGQDVAICFLDLDGFKAVNDEFGHHAGDLLLIEVARRISQCIRTSDTAARLGGDEFVLLLAPVAGEEWRIVVERVMESVNSPIQLEPGTFVNVGLTMGVSLSRGRASSEVLVAEADEAMLRAKRAGKQRVERF